MADSSEDIGFKFDKVLKFLSYRSRSEFEIKEYMLRKGWDEKTRNIILEKLKELKFINDEDFARQWLASRSHSRPKGRFLVKMELQKKGVDKEIINELLLEERKVTTEETLAEEYGQKKLERLKGLPVLEIKRKLYSALVMRGFSAEIVGRVIDKLLKEEYNSLT